MNGYGGEGGGYGSGDSLGGSECREGDVEDGCVGL